MISTEHKCLLVTGSVAQILLYIQDLMLKSGRGLVDGMGWDGMEISEASDSIREAFENENGKYMVRLFVKGLKNAFFRHFLSLSCDDAITQI